MRKRRDAASCVTKGRESAGFDAESIVARGEDRVSIRVPFVPSTGETTCRPSVRANIAEPRARHGKARGKRERRSATSRFPDTSRPIGRETRPTRSRVLLLTYASHVDRSSRLLVQRVENISATLTCAAITTAAILDSPFPRWPRIRRVRERRRAAGVGARVSPSRDVAFELSSFDRSATTDKSLI